MKVANRIANSPRHRIRLSVFAMMMGGSLALASMSLPVSAHSRIPTTTTIRLQRRTVAAHGQKSLIPFRPQSLQNSTAGVPGGVGPSRLANGYGGLGLDPTAYEWRIFETHDERGQNLGFLVYPADCVVAGSRYWRTERFAFRRAAAKAPGPPPSCAFDLVAYDQWWRGMDAVDAHQSSLRTQH